VNISAIYVRFYCKQTVEIRRSWPNATCASRTPVSTAARVT